MTPLAAAPLSLRLRDETRAEHDAIEAALDWERRVASPAAYREWLERLWGFHFGWEPAVRRWLGDDAFARLPLLATDLERLGVTADDRAALPIAPPLPLASPAEALGSLYVIEGSMLGGQLIARRVAQAFGFVPAYHGGYLHAGNGWRAFRQQLDALPAADGDAAVAVALRTFVFLREWLA